MNKLVVQKYLTDNEVSNLEGTWIDESFLKHPVIRENTDVYYKDENDKEHLLLKFRKNSISNSLLRNSYLPSFFIASLASLISSL